MSDVDDKKRYAPAETSTGLINPVDKGCEYDNGIIINKNIKGQVTPGGTSLNDLHSKKRDEYQSEANRKSKGNIGVKLSNNSPKGFNNDAEKTNPSSIQLMESRDIIDAGNRNTILSEKMSNRKNIIVKKSTPPKSKVARMIQERRQ